MQADTLRSGGHKSKDKLDEDGMAGVVCVNSLDKKKKITEEVWL